MIVAYRNGSPVRLNELGRVIDSVQDDKSASWYNGDRAVVLAIQRQPGTNTVEVVNGVKKLLPRLEQQIPAAVRVDTLYDRSESIRASVNDVKFTLLLTIALVVMVIFLFLRNISATIIPSFALPMAIIGTFSVMYLLGYSVDNLSLMALTLSVGFVVDDAIVMLENIVRHMEMGKSAMQASIEGSREIGFTILSMTISLAAVFIPLLFMGGIIGRLLHEFAVTIGVAILVSGFVSLTLTPMLCSRFLKHQATSEHGRFYQATERVFDGWLRGYDWSLKKVLRHKFATLMVSFVVIALTAFLFVGMRTGFLPDEDQGLVFAFTEAQQGISFHDMFEAAAEGHRRGAPGPQRDEPDFIHGRESFLRRLLEPGPHVLPPEGQEGPRQPHERHRDHSGTAPQGGAGARHQRVPADSADHPHRRQPDEIAVPVRPADARIWPNSIPARPSWRRRCAGCPCCRT